MLVETQFRQRKRSSFAKASEDKGKVATISFNFVNLKSLILVLKSIEY
jgi:hypothetical protein